MSAPRSPEEYGDGPPDDAALEADGWAAGLDVWGPVAKAYANAVGDSTLANSQLWSLRQAVRAELRAEVVAWLKGDELCDRVAEATERHHLTDRTDADGHSACSCGTWWDSSETDGWDQHMAHVTLDFLAEEVGRG